ncbi:amidohydrolase/deacetylase family metallohydrolase [Culicoidibacter larvae]|uniref:Amidohydrolase/deacetylase family metallohydrolase n=1 Tax=Culicoidibacter larvae TaxID=2579976 RepID=A0A5R8Q748_9FIRM|nr:amidohydrolase/deacetylase family metallohydrolase [Culicoidibacter larvae]TLG71239.1 amidohydrolase/deacetylase family metallohydrolase [Culicoidibacter larvae]
MMGHLLKSGILLDTSHPRHLQQTDILIEDGKISQVAANIAADEHEVIELSGKYVSAGWIDMHAHTFTSDGPLSTDADLLGVEQGVSMVIDAGTAGSDDMPVFFEQMQTKKTKIKAFINVSSMGIASRYELRDLNQIRFDDIRNTYKNYQDFIVGIKVRESGSVVGENGVQPLVLGQTIAKELGLPIMVHIGNTPPELLDILALLKRGDIVTHIYNGKANNIFQGGDVVHPDVIAAHQRGVIFDIGHGRDSFSFDVARRALAQGLVTDTISTDGYTENLPGPVKSLANVVTKFLHLGMPLADCIDKITAKPAAVLGLENGRVLPGLPADITVFSVIREEVELVDSTGAVEIGQQFIQPEMVFIDGDKFLVHPKSTCSQAVIEPLDTAEELNSMELVDLGVRRVINASGRMTKLGVSTPSASVLAAMNRGADSYVLMDELIDAAGQFIASEIGAADVCVTTSASSGIVLTIASLIAKNNIEYIENLTKYSSKLPNQVLMLKGHNVNYNVPIETMVNLGGGVIKEVGSANQASRAQLEAAVSDDTIALFYVKSHHTVQKNMVSLEDMIAVAKAYHLPLIVDAAAEEDFSKYLAMGADLVIYSGTKALCGPTSGFVAGSDAELIANIKAQYRGIGRAMKVGKETIYGLVQAVAEFMQAPPKPVVTQTELEAFMGAVNQIAGLTAEFEDDESGRAIARVQIHVDERTDGYGKNALTLVSELAQGEVAIFTRDYYANVGHFSIDPRPLLAGDLDIILSQLQNLQGE